MKSRLTSDAKLIIVLNKTDQVEDLLTPQETIRLFTSGEEIIPISARTGANLDRLIQELTRTVNLNTLNTSDVIVSNVRHYEALRNARTAIERVNEGLESGLSGDSSLRISVSVFIILVKLPARLLRMRFWVIFLRIFASVSDGL